MSEITISEAVTKITDELRANKEFYFAYQSNIAMSFYDAMKPRLDDKPFNPDELLLTANEAAVNFMELWVNSTESSN